MGKYRYDPREKEEAFRKHKEKVDYPERDSYLRGTVLSQYKSQPGDNYIDIIPPEKGWPGFRLFVHYDVGVDNSSVICNLNMNKEYNADYRGVFEKRCVICEEAQKMEEEDDRRDLRQSTRILFVIVDRFNRETEDKGLQLYDAPVTIDKALRGFCEHPRTKEFVDIFNPVTGFTLYFERKGKAGDKKTKYENFKLVDRKPLPNEWLEFPCEWIDFLVVRSYEEISEMFFGGEKPFDKAGEERERTRGRDENESRGSRLVDREERTGRETDREEEPEPELGREEKEGYRRKRPDRFGEKVRDRR